MVKGKEEVGKHAICKYSHFHLCPGTDKTDDSQPMTVISDLSILSSYIPH